MEISPIPYKQHKQEGRLVYVLTQPFAYVVHLPAIEGQQPRDMAIVVPRAFATDFYSIPKELQPLFVTTGHYPQAAVLHDWLYAIGENGDPHGRAIADEVIRQTMLQESASRHLADDVHLGVSQFGAKNYGGGHELRFYDRHGPAHVGYFSTTPAQRQALRQATICTPSSRAVATSTESSRDHS